MIEFNFAATNGGRLAFRSTEEVAEFAQEQHRKWMALGPSNGDEADRRLFQPVASQWRQLSTRAAEATDDAKVKALTRIGGVDLVVFEGLEGQALQTVRNELGADAAMGVMEYRGTPPTHQFLANLTKLRAQGLFRYSALVEGLTKSGSATARGAFTKTMARLTDDVATHRNELEQSLTEANSTLEGFRERADSEFELYRIAHRERLEEADTERASRAELWEDLRNQFTKQLTIEAPVKLWDDRATEHQTAAKSYRRWACIVGIVGLGATYLVALGALESRAGYSPTRWPQG